MISFFLYFPQAERLKGREFMSSIIFKLASRYDKNIRMKRRGMPDRKITSVTVSVYTVQENSYYRERLMYKYE
ncbi:hypothetical protein DTG28_04640 [Salmonella enterica subsp. salamae]|nr:hypothetical protein [Salmonella enterica subsp. salamae]